MAKKKTIMKEFSINEISSVDDPAQEDARMCIMKRAPIAKNPLDEEPKEDPAEEAGESQAEEDAEAAVEGGKTKKESKMTDDEKKAAAAKVKADAEAAATKKSLDDATAENAVLKAVAEMNDAEKTIYKALDADGQKAWLKKSADERKAEVAKEIAKAADANPVVFKSADGAEFRKSDDPRLVAMAKARDVDAAELAKERGLRIDNDFAKRATDEMNFIKGDAKAKIALLKAVAGIADEEVRKEVNEILKAANLAFSPAFKSLGITKAEVDASTPEGKLDSLAKSYQKDKKVSYAVAYDEVLKTAEGTELYNETQKK